MNTSPIRVLVVDDSALVRKIVTDSLKPFRDIEVVGTAVDPYVARDKILSLNPDVLTLDIEMPRMDGISFLKVLMQQRPMPVIIMSSLTEAGSDRALEALNAGAVSVVAKPGGAYSASEDGTRLAQLIRSAVQSRPRRPAVRPPTPPVGAVVKRSPTPTPPPLERRSAAPSALGTDRPDPRAVLLLGASTGGTEALRTVLSCMSGHLPPILVVQHIPAYFSKAFAARLDQCCQMEVREAVHGDIAKPGLALVAPGDFHMVLRWIGAHYIVELNRGPQIHHQRPAVDILFDSAVRAGAGPAAIAALLTGMGADGAAGLLRLRQAGAATIAQDEESCVVFGMPKEAIRMGAAQVVLPLDRIGPRLDQLARNARRALNPAPAGIGA